MLGIGAAKRLNQPVGRHRIHHQPWGQPVNPLPVQRIHPRAGHPGKQMQRAAWRKIHPMGWHILLGQGHGSVFAVVVQPAHMVHRLVQRATHRHVNFLKAPAHAKYRHAARNRRLHQPQCHVITGRVGGGIGVVQGVAIALGKNIGIGAG